MKLIELYDDYKEKLSIDEVQGCFRRIITKCKKMQKPEVKEILEELEKKLSSSKKGVVGLKAQNQAAVERLKAQLPRQGGR